ncbi:MAG: hypothetical protein WD512_20920 [Candidatus Paceibacterota bacterium]
MSKKEKSVEELIRDFKKMIAGAKALYASEILSRNQACAVYDIASYTLNRYVEEGLIMKYNHPINGKHFYIKSEIDKMFIDKAKEEIKNKSKR